MHSFLHAGSASHQPPALPPVSDYLATSSSLDTRVPALCDTIDHLSGCLERVVTKVAEGAISSHSSSSRHFVVQKTEESTFHPKCALRTVPAYSSSVFTASVPAAVVDHADPLPHNVWALGSVTNQHASAGPPPLFVGVPEAV